MLFFARTTAAAFALSISATSGASALTPLAKSVDAPEAIGVEPTVDTEKKEQPSLNKQPHLNKKEPMATSQVKRAKETDAKEMKVQPSINKKDQMGLFDHVPFPEQSE
jgi:hypothetical protein